MPARSVQQAVRGSLTLKRYQIMSTQTPQDHGQPHKLFAYADKPPRIPNVPGCSGQRWFDGDLGGGWTVLRHDHRDVCNVGLAIDSAGVCAVAEAKLTPAQLRDLAARLLRAADDIDAHPAAEWSGS